MVHVIEEVGLCSLRHDRVPGRRHERVVFNVCGAKYEILESTLQRYPGTLLANQERRRTLFWDEEKKEFFLDRNRSCFKAVLTFYHSYGCLTQPEGIPDAFFNSEMQFYGLRKEKKKRDRLEPSNQLQKQVWNLFDNPASSNAARLLAWFSCSIVLLSIVLFCVETLPNFQNEQGVIREEEKNIILIIEAFCISWFTVEYIVRLLSSPAKARFLVEWLNIIDLVAILPFFLTLALDNRSSSVTSMAVIRAIRLVRVFRIFKLSRYSQGLKILGKTLKASLTELGLLSFFLAVGVVLFSSAVYFAEYEENKEMFTSIPHSFWWAIVTMTTVGYGDMYPITLPGKLVGTLCAFCGILVIALPVPVIVANFEHFYTNQTQEVDLDFNKKESRFKQLQKFCRRIRKQHERNKSRSSYNDQEPSEIHSQSTNDRVSV